jgi:hypothetical protein
MELLKSKGNDMPSFGAVGLKFPFGMDVAAKSFADASSSSSARNSRNGAKGSRMRLDTKFFPASLVHGPESKESRLVVNFIAPGGYAEKASIRKGDIIRAVSFSPGRQKSKQLDPSWWATKVPDTEEGMLILDGKPKTELISALRQHDADGEVVFLIERPVQWDASEGDDDWFVGGGGFGARVTELFDVFGAPELVPEPAPR